MDVRRMDVDQVSTGNSRCICTQHQSGFLFLILFCLVFVETDRQTDRVQGKYVLMFMRCRCVDCVFYFLFSCNSREDMIH